jgi:hypothetical protein
MAMPKQNELEVAFAVNKSMEALRALTQDLPPAVLNALVTKEFERPYSFLVELMTQVAPFAARESTAFDRAAARGLRVREELLDQEGGLISAANLGSLFRPSLSRQGIDQRRKKNKLLAFADGSGNLLYPVWQVHRGAVLPGFVETLSLLGADPMATVVFLLQPDPRIKGQRPLDVARAGKAKLVVELASTFGEHGAL